MSALGEQTKPLARSEGLVVQELSDEVLVYDLERDKAHCLNQTAALVWKYCDGKTTVSEIARILFQESGLLADEEVVWLGLRQLNKFDLLQEQMAPSAGPALISRRELGRRLGAVAASSLPLIVSVVAPTAAQAASGGLPNGSSCEVDPECASNCCVANLCSPVAECGTFAAQERRQPANSRR